MKNRELKRLNLVLHNGKIKTIDCIAPGQVILLEDRKTEESFGGWLDLDEIEFISLTHEWLIKLGWKYFNGKTDGTLTMDLEGKLDIDFHEGELKVKSHYEGEQLYRKLYNIKYVHQLQNLYFILSGNELTISK